MSLIFDVSRSEIYLRRLYRVTKSVFVKAPPKTSQKEKKPPRRRFFFFARRERQKKIADAGPRRGFITGLIATRRERLANNTRRKNVELSKTIVLLRNERDDALNQTVKTKEKIRELELAVQKALREAALLREMIADSDAEVQNLRKSYATVEDDISEEESSTQQEQLPAPLADPVIVQVPLEEDSQEPVIEPPGSNSTTGTDQEEEEEEESAVDPTFLPPTQPEEPPETDTTASVDEVQEEEEESQVEEADDVAADEEEALAEVDASVQGNQGQDAAVESAQEPTVEDSPGEENVETAEAESSESLAEETTDIIKPQPVPDAVSEISPTPEKDLSAPMSDVPEETTQRPPAANRNVPHHNTPLAPITTQLSQQQPQSGVGGGGLEYAPEFVPRQTPPAMPSAPPPSIPGVVVPPPPSQIVDSERRQVSLSYHFSHRDHSHAQAAEASRRGVGSRIRRTIRFVFKVSALSVALSLVIRMNPTRFETIRSQIWPPPEAVLSRFRRRSHAEEHD